MDNKGFAISGIIYTLCILFLIILLTTISGLNLLQKLKVNSVQNFEEVFKGRKMESEEFLYLNEFKVAPVTGKYVFQVTKVDEEVINECVAYLKRETNIISDYPTFFPNECNEGISSIRLVEIYVFD